MEKVLNQAEILAEAILESEEYIRMRLSEQAAMKDERATQLVAAYSEKRSKVEEVLSANNMDHDALAKAGAELETAEKEVDDYQLLKDMCDARDAFSNMMSKVNDMIKFVVTGETPEPEQSGCGGSCSGCGGGCHGH